MPTPWTPTSVLAQAVYAAGFLYDPGQDIIYSRMDALQRNFGYAFGYDSAALAMNAVIDCEPIFFDYDGKHWMIELWKGQYGLETGCEIGVYTRPIGSTGAGYALLDSTVGRRPGDGVPSHNLFYNCASDADRLELSATLRRNGTVLFTRGPEMHWWLTGFKWGVLSDPAQLSVDVAITLKDDAMRDAFLVGISGRPYPNLQINGTAVSFTFGQPFAQPQPPRPGPVLAAVEAANKEIVSSYNTLRFPNNDPNDVQAEFLGVAGLGILHLGDHYGLIAAQLATELGLAIGSVVTALVDGFGVAASTAEGWLNGVAPEFASWVSAVEQYFGLPLDFSCYVAVDNTQGSSDLLLAGSSATSGSYVISPPAWIPKGAVGRFVIQDPKPSISGSKGSATYAYADADLVMRAVKFTFTCPTGFASNEADASRPEWSRLAKSGNVNDPWSATVPGGGHPLYLTYAIEAAAPPAPVVTELAPATGSALGGDRIEVYGTHLQTTRQVSFGGVPAEHFTVYDDTHLWAVPPAGSGQVDVSVTTAGGTATTAGFTYIAGLPVVESVTPSSGPNTGNTPVTISGRGLDQIHTAQFGVRPEPAAPQSSSSATTSNGPGAGVVHVQVSGGPSGPSQTSDNDLFSYLGPVILSLDPPHGDEAGGTLVTIHGTGLSGATSVTFGGSLATDLVCVSDTVLTVRSPSGAGTPDVLVTALGVTSLPSMLPSHDDLYIYDGPTLESVSPSSGPDTGNTTVTLSGTMLDHVETVFFNEAAVPFTLASLTSLTAVVPPWTWQWGVTIYARSRYGSRTNMLNYVYQPTPAITGISPVSGPQDGQTTVSITGHDLMHYGPNVYFGELIGFVSSHTDTQITVETPSGTGQVPIAVDEGVNTTTVIGQYTYLSPNPLAITSLSPATGPASGGTPVIITGTGLTDVMTLSFGTRGVIFTRVSDTEIQAVAPPGTGTVYVQATTWSLTTNTPGPGSRFTYV